MAVNVLDRLIGLIDPSRGLRRVVDRIRLQRAYEAASPRDTWRPRRGGASAQADHFADSTMLRIKARALVQNVPYISASMDALVTNVIGTGITPRFTGPDEKKLNALWKDWADVCDADGRLDFYGMEAAAYRAMEQDGEVLVRLRARRPEDRLPVPLQLQLLEIDWLDSTRNSLLPGGGGSDVTPSNVIVEGIEYDPIGRVAAYWLWDQHPGDATVLRGFRNFSKRVPASSIIHLYDPKRPGQGRGITRLAPVIARTRDTQLYEDAELARKNLETRLSVLVSGDASLLANENQLGGTSANGAADAGLARRTGDLGELASGGITELPSGSNITTVEPKAAGGHVEYVTHQLHIITAALGVTYEMATGDMSQVNFSSARVRLQDVRKGFEHTQWMIVIPRMCRPLADAFAASAMLAGKVRDGAAYGVAYDTPKWDYVNPQQEAEADIKQVSAGLSSLSAKLRARGENPDTVFAELASDFEKLKALGVLDTLFFLQKGTVRVTEQDANASAVSQGRADLEALMQRTESRFELLERRMPEIHLHAGDTTVNTPASSVNVEAAQIHVPPAEVRNEIHVEPTPVTVAAANIEVHPPEIRNEINVEAAKVTVQPAEVQLHMPVRKTETTITRDGSGRVSGSKIVESDDPPKGKR
jgi:lambda family phage portal protein